MPEHTVVPRGRAIRPVPLPDGALEDIRARAHRRRAGRAALAGSAGLTAVVLVAATVLTGTLGGSRDDSLRVVPAESVPELVPVAPEPEASPAPAEAAAPVAPQDAPVAAAPPAAAPQPVRRTAAPEQPAPEPAPTRGGRERPYDPDPLRSDDGIIVLLPECEQVGRGSVDGWCLSVFGGGDQGLMFTACRARGYGAGRLDWATSKQVHFEVRNAAGRLVWSYQPRVRPEPSSDVVPAEGCLGWELPYRAVDDEGEPLPDGEYTLRGSSTATSLRGIHRENPFFVGEQQPIDADARTYAVPAVPSIG